MFYKDGIDENSDVPQNEKFDGYVVAFIKEVMEELKLPYEIQLVADNDYGKELVNGSWDGMVGEVIRGVRDKITITTQHTRSHTRAHTYEYIL